MRNAITGLVRGYADISRYKSLIQRNRAIVERVLPVMTGAAGKPDLLLFHEGNIPPAHQAHINAASGAEFRFVDLRATAPRTGFDPRREQPNLVREMQGFGPGYRHMCHFWFVDYIDYLADYRFVARIDEDCIVHEWPDLFTLMQARGTVYTSAGQITDSPEAVIGMTEFSRFFRAARREPTSGVPLDKTGPMTNLMALDLAYFRAHAAYQDYRAAITRSGMVYSHRWGDLPLWGEFLSLYVPPERLDLNSQEISYFHGSHGALINIPYGNAGWLRQLRKVSLGKPAAASALIAGSGGDAAAAVNGHPTGRFAFHTAGTPDPCWQVDLQAEEIVRAIRIFNRSDACQERAIGLQVEVSTDGKHYSGVRTLDQRFGGLFEGTPALIDLRDTPELVRARYVRLRLPRQDYLHLDQVEVFA